MKTKTIKGLKGETINLSATLGYQNGAIISEEIILAGKWINNNGYRRGDRIMVL